MIPSKPLQKLCFFSLLLLNLLHFIHPLPSTAASASITIDASKTTGLFKTIITTQLGYQGAPAKAVSLFKELAPGSPVRIHMSPYSDHPLLAEKAIGVWDFSALDEFVNEIASYGGKPLLNVKFPPPCMWSCQKWQAPGTILDSSYSQFGDYLARMVSYYNKGKMTTEKGEVITNP